MKIIEVVLFFSLINFTCLQEIPSLVRVRSKKKEEGAEFVALDTVGLIELWGYPVHQHNITTSDGYILNIFRVPWSPTSLNKTEQRPVIILMTGILCSSDNWNNYGPNRSLAMQLADTGYDVWMGNYRGTTYGRAHVALSPDDRKFWNFSYHEIGIDDVPCMIDYVLKITNQSSLKYVGYSMGSSLALVMLSEKPEYNNKIQLLVTMAPVSSLKKNNMRNFVQTVTKIIKNLLEPNGDAEVFPQSSTLAGFLKRICIPLNIVDFCLMIVDYLAGKDRDQFDEDSLIELSLYFPSGSSAKTFWHFLQTPAGKFRQYDYESAVENIRHYGRPEPPLYNLKNVRTPIVNFYGKNDPASTKEDVQDLMEKVSAKSIFKAIRLKTFNHLDFLFSKDVKKLVNDRIIKKILEFDNGEIFSQSKNS